MENFANAEKSRATFKVLRRLHGHNLESQGLNNLSEAFQSFVTRAKFFSLGKLRRTWSHSAVEFMKYRRLLPMIVNDEHEPGSVFDEFADIGPDGLPYTAPAEVNLEKRRISVSSVSAKATRSQLQSFFSKFGKVHSCHIPFDKKQRELGLYATMPRRKCHGTCVITFKDVQSAWRAKNAQPEELIFYGQQMSITPYIPPTNVGSQRASSKSIQSRGMPPSDMEKCKTTQGGPAQQQTLEEAVRHQQQEAASAASSSTATIVVLGAPLSRTSSASSLASTGTVSSALAPFSAIPLDELPDRVLVSLLAFLPPLDRIRLERVNKRWLEAAAKAWAECHQLRLDHLELAHRPMGTFHLRAILRRCGVYLRGLSLANVRRQFLDEKSIGEIGTLCPNLTKLDISGVAASPEALRALTESTPKLTALACRGMTQTSERAFLFLFKPCANRIRSMDLRGCARLRGRFFKLFGTELEEALLDGCRQIDNEAIEDICTRCVCLQTLKLDGCAKLSDESLSLISRHLSELRTFTLCGEFPRITNLTQLTTIQTLQVLAFDYNPCVDDTFLSSLSEQLPSLRQLSLAFAGSDKSITAFGLKKLSSLAALESLDLSGLAALSNQILAQICRQCSELRKLSLRNCIYLGNEGMDALGNLIKLEFVDLSGCILVSNESVQKICNSFKRNEVNPEVHLCLVIGGTICEPHKIRIPLNSSVILDPIDNSTLKLDDYLMMNSAANKTSGGGDVEQTQCVDEEEEEDDEFSILSAHRDFVTDALQNEDNEMFPDGDPQSIMEWVKKEAANMDKIVKP